MAYFEVLVALFSIVVFCCLFRDKTGLPTNWPFVGMIPAIVVNVHRLHDYIVEAPTIANNLNFHFKGPWLSNFDLIATLDPASVHHVFSKNFDKYHKGPKFKEMFFEAFGDGVINADGHIWEYHHKILISHIRDPRFHPFYVKTVRDKVESGLIPVLNRATEQGLDVDLQDLFTRCMLDVTCTFFMRQDPGYLSTDGPVVPVINVALDDIMRTAVYRMVMPSWVWKLRRWLVVGSEKVHKEANETIDKFMYQWIAWKREQISKGHNTQQQKDLMTIYLEDMEGSSQGTAPRPVTTDGNKFVRDSMMAALVAGRDTVATTLSWFFYVLSQNHQVLNKIKQELDAATAATRHINDVKEPKISLHEFNDYELVYLHAALCETLRLYPPVPFEAKSPIGTDILPSGFRVYPYTVIAFSLYAMGRMKSLWGDDCCEFKPERWITPEGKIRFVPPRKFLAFSAGPRVCLGKNLSFAGMKIIAATIIQNYNIQPVEGCIVVPEISTILRMKNGYKVRVLKY